MQSKIKVYSIYTSKYHDLMKLFSKSLSHYPDNFELIKIECDKSDEGDFLSDGYKKIIDFKISHIIRTIKENMGDVILWSDCDILFFKNPFNEIINYAKEYDLCGMQEPYQNRHPPFNRLMNGGFLIIKCSEKTLALWEKIVFILSLTKYSKDPGLYEQDVLNYLINLRETDIKYLILPDSFWATSRGERFDNNVTICHFTALPNCEGNTHTERKYNQMLKIIDKKGMTPKLI